MTDPQALDVPSSLETERLSMRPPRIGDGALLLDAVTESLPELRRFLASLPWVAAEQTLAASEAYCAAGAENFDARTDLPFLLFERATDSLVGVAGLHRPVWATPKVEVGYWGRTSASGRGLVGEGVRALTTMAFDRLRVARVELVTDEENLASRRLAERCGFTLDGVLRHERRAPDGSLRNTCIYSRLGSTAV